MVKMVLEGIIIAEAVFILFQWRKNRRLKKEIEELQQKYEERQALIDELQREGQETEGQETEASIDRFATHDKIIEMSDLGADAEMISERLGVPRRKVEMTLKFEKMKKDGA